MTHWGMLIWQSWKELMHIPYVQENPSPTSKNLVYKKKINKVCIDMKRYAEELFFGMLY